MPVYTISIQLEAATNSDYEQLSLELEKKSFQAIRKPVQPMAGSSWSPFICKSSNVSSLADLSSTVSYAASNTGKKFIFTIIKDKLKTI